MEIFLLFCIIAYLFGAIPFGLLLTRVFLKQDITQIGSGNIGATNVLRAGNKKLAAATLLLDALKGVFVIAAYIALTLPVYYSNCPSIRCESTTGSCGSCWESYIGAGYANFLILGLAAILGHCYPIWLKFKGGKGVATTLGVLLAAVPFAGMLACITWLVSAFAGRMSSLAAMSAMVCAPAFTYTFYGLYPALINILISLLVIWRHRENIKRIRAGTEPKIGEKK